MYKEDEEKKDEKGFIIVDKRRGSAEKDASSADSTDKIDKDSHKKSVLEEQERLNIQDTDETPLPELDFASFIITLSHSVYIHLGELPEPSTNKKNVNLPLAKQTIDLIAMLKQKTAGNRNEDEDKIIDEILYQLRMSYVAATKGNK